MDTLFRITAVFLLSLLLAGPAGAQTAKVQNGGTVQIQNGGVWDLEGGTMDFGPAGSTAALDEQSEGRATGGTLTAVRALSDPSSADPAGLGLLITAGADLGNVTVTRGHMPQSGDGNTSIERYYDLSPDGTNSNLNAELTFTYNDDEHPNLPESELVFFKSTDGGSTWSKEGYDSKSAVTNDVTLSGIDSFSRWTLGSDSEPLPVELTAFDGTQVGPDAVRLQWTTAAEQKNAGFRIERAIEDEDGGASDWTEVGSVEGAGTTDDPQSYQFLDEKLPYAADRVAYRLKQVDTDGTTSVSEEVIVERGAVTDLQLLGPYPNPARSQVTVRYALPDRAAPGDATLRLYDAMGREVRTVKTAAKTGRHERLLNTEGLSSGIYFLRLRAAGTVKTRKVTLVR